MGSIYGNPTVRARSTRQLNYLKDKKTDRGRNNKAEEQIQIELCAWMREVIPDIHFRSDTGSGAYNSKYAKNTHNKQQSASELPDVTIFAARRGYHGLFIELKKDGTNLKMKRDGTKIRVRKDRKGRIIERDYKIRKKGDWSSLHIEKQAQRMTELRKSGYLAMFSVGLDKAKEIVAWYFDLKLPKNEQLF